MRRGLSVIVSAVSLLSGIAACSSKSAAALSPEGGGDDGGYLEAGSVASADSSPDADWAATDAGGCSNGPEYTRAAAFHYDPNGMDKTLPACVPHCRARLHSGGFYSIGGLPSGACNTEGYSCNMAASSVQTADSGIEYLCSVSGYECGCTLGTWTCVVVAQGGGPICDPPADSGTD